MAAPRMNKIQQDKKLTNLLFEAKWLSNNVPRRRTSFACPAARVRTGPLFHLGYHSNTPYILLQESKMAASDVEVSSSLDQEEDPSTELSDEDLYNLVQETM